MSAIEYDGEEIERRCGVSPKPPPEHFAPVALGQSIARRYGLTYSEMIGPCRVGVYPKARRAFYLALRERGWSYPQIGKFVGGRDHTTVMYAVKRRPS